VDNGQSEKDHDMALKPRQEKFAQLIAKSPKTGMSITDCYLAAGYKTEGESAHAAASRLLGTVTVKARVDEILRPAVVRTRVSVESLLNELEQTISAARRDGHHGAVVQALTLSAKLVGLLREKVEEGGSGFALCNDLEEMVNKLLSEMPASDALETLETIKQAILMRAADQATAIPGPPASRVDEVALARDLFRKH
jgi:Terminase small subunit